MTRNQTHRKGIALPYAIVILLGLTAIASLAVDFGRVMLVKAQLHAAADAAALAGGQDLLSDLTASRAAAVAIAKANNANGAGVVLASSDIEYGYWDEKARTFTLASSTVKPNAIRVTAHCSAARGTAVDLPFSKMLGIGTCDVQGQAIALATPQRFAAVGLDFITMGGNATNAYRSNAPASGNFSSNGSVASNGDITLTGSTLIEGNAFCGVGKMVYGSSHVSGYTMPLSKPLVYPAADPGDALWNNNDSAIPTWALKNGSIVLGNQQVLTLPAGTYFVRDLNMGAGSAMNFTGPATFYLTGNLSLGGQAATNMNLPKNLRIVLLSTGTTVSISAGSDLYADIYAPLSAITVSGNGDIYGSIVGKNLSMTGEAGIHYDQSLVGGVRLVK